MYKLANAEYKDYRLKWEDFTIQIKKADDMPKYYLIFKRFWLQNDQHFSYKRVWFSSLDLANGW